MKPLSGLNLHTLFGQPGLSDFFLLERDGGSFEVWCRINGTCQPLGTLGAGEANPGSIMAVLRRHQDADHTLHWDNRRLRVHVQNCEEGREWSLRLLPDKPPEPLDLPLPKTSLDWFLQQERGLILFSGPTGAGKSTTIASLLSHLLKRFPRRLLTFEDPIEYLLQTEGTKGFCRQREKGRHFRDFAEALRCSLRQSPDIIMVQEIRDPETARIALSAGLSGHLVLASIHGSTVGEALQRMFYLLGEETDWGGLALVLTGVFSQRLVLADGPAEESCSPRRVALFSHFINREGLASILQRRSWNQLNQLIEVGRTEGMIDFSGSMEILRRRGVLKR